MESFKDFAEALTMQQRMKAKQNFRKNKGKIKMGRKRAEKRTATTDVLKNRAAKAARKTVEKKLLQGKDKSDLSFAARQNLEKRVDKKKSAVDRLAKKLVPVMRKKELERKRNRNSPDKQEAVNEKLNASQPVSAWIDDFIKSDAPQFAGKSKKERIDMALAAHRSANMSEDSNQMSVGKDAVKKVNKKLKKNVPGQSKINPPSPF